MSEEKWQIRARQEHQIARAAEADLAYWKSRAKLAEAALNEAVIKVENDRTMRNEEWLIWLYDARAAIAQKDAEP